MTNGFRAFGPFLILLVAGGISAQAHDRVIRARTPVRIPDLPGYLTLKCDFHIHTVFSDGTVWPSVRSEEAWREGLDAIAITDHIEYQPHKDDLPTSHNRAFDVARPLGQALNVIVIRGSEITRKMPPGHLNAIFLTDSAALDVETWQEALAEANRQGAFVFWNHPGWGSQLQEDGIVRWYPEHTELLEKGMMHGIEVANGRSVYPEAFAWALEKKLTLLSNSDIHSPLNLDYHVHDGDHRPLTLVFAKERSAQGILEALKARRTAVYAGSQLLGEERFLKPIFERSVHLLKANISLTGTGHVLLQIHNDSEIPYQLERAGGVRGLQFPSSLTLPAQQTILAEVKSTSASQSGTRTVTLPYRVKNVLVSPTEALEVGLHLEVTFQPRE
jgi:hypothetical protein